ncbi:MAG: GNAT family N-acetyltransferase [Thomasclavelia sp.]|jgi:predicted GNAT family acetyltransferase|nr:GNAT family N-acetyltransferase [Thomasclavelia sp.]
MEIKFENNFIYAYNDRREEMGHIEFLHEDKHTINAIHTIVYKQYQGKGVAGELFEGLVNYAKENKVKIIPTCSYIAKKMEDPKYEDVKVK